MLVKKIRRLFNRFTQIFLFISQQKSHKTQDHHDYYELFPRFVVCTLKLTNRHLKMETNTTEYA